MSNSADFITQNVDCCQNRIQYVSLYFSLYEKSLINNFVSKFCGINATKYNFYGDFDGAGL